ncbi:tryptophan--tRNA ligase [Candidatus Saccharibacteria bacterium]|nr:tryptophan--tRNA ligase [Candidatus Saccharibacteria bacterium]
MKKTILTGLRVNSELTLGNYLGALLPMVRLANKYSKDYNVNIFIPDLHSIISEIDGNLQQNTLNSIKYYLAAGLELNENIHIYRQSRVPAHAELAWVLNCIATMGEMSRMTQFKEKSEGKDSTNVGIFDYPVLMAADILLYDASFVPVGEDQFQHIELTRNLATRFNHRFGDTFTVPEDTKKQVEFMGVDTGIRIRDLVNPEKKMSKSTAGDNCKIMLSDEPEKAAKKIMSATTDSLEKIDFNLETQAGVSNLLQIEALTNDIPLGEVIREWQGKTRYGDLKKQVAESVKVLLANFQQNLAQIPDDTVKNLLPEGEKYANEIANQKLADVYAKIGLR